MEALAKVAPDYGHVDLVIREQPEPKQDQVLIEVAYAGLCGSDAGIYASKPGYEFLELPRVIGHKYAGAVVKMGANVNSPTVGDTVVERPLRPCGDCASCRRGTPNVCQDVSATGFDHDGAYAPYIAAPEDVLTQIPDAVSLRHAATIEPISVATRAVVVHSRVSAGDQVLVQGPGPIGFLTAQIARAQGATVVLSGTDADTDYRLRLADELGFETVLVDEVDIETMIADQTDGVGFDVVFDATGHPSGLAAGSKAARNGGQLVLVGLPGVAEVDFAAVVRSELDLQCSYASTRADVERAVRLLVRNTIEIDPLLDDDVSLLRPEEAFETFLAGDVVKPVFDVSELQK